MIRRLNVTHQVLEYYVGTTVGGSYVHAGKNHHVFVIPCQNVNLGKMVEITKDSILAIKAFRPRRAIR